MTVSQRQGSEIMLTNDLYLSGHYPRIEDIDSVTCSTINTNNITYNKLQRLVDIPGMSTHFIKQLSQSKSKSKVKSQKDLE